MRALRWIRDNGWVVTGATLILLLVALAGNYYRDDATRDVVTRIETRTMPGPCDRALESRACEQEMVERIRTLGDRALCVLARQLDMPCPETPGDRHDARQPAPENRPTTGPVPAVPGAPVPVDDGPGPGDGGSPPAAPPDTPTPDPPASEPPTPPAPPEPPPSVIGSGIHTPADPVICNLPVRLCK